MFITNTATPGEILAELLLPVGRTIGDDFKSLRHNDDLCPRFQETAEYVLTSYAKYHASVDDIQGFTDQGVDVLVRYSDEEGNRHNIGLQIKSHREIADDLRLPSGQRRLIPLLSQQRTRAQSKHQIETFYVILCGDASREHRDFVRRAKAEFSSLNDTRIVTPGQAWHFFNLRRHEIAAYCASILCKDDYVLSAVRDLFGERPDDYRRMMIGWVVSQLEGQDNVTVDKLVGYAEGGTEVEQGALTDKVAEYLTDLQFDASVENLDGEAFRLNPSEHNELRALYFDLRVRHGLMGQDAIEYLWKLTD